MAQEKSKKRLNVNIVKIKHDLSIREPGISAQLTI